MPVDPVIQGLLDKMASDGTPALDDMSVEAARAFTKAMGAGSELEEVESVEDTSIGGVPIRIYLGHGTDQNAPIFIWLHGGGFVLGDIERADPIARRFSNRIGARVVSVDYRLAPEHTYPAALDDGRSILEWALNEHVPVALGGDSAGANVAACLALEARDRGIVLEHQLLVYPWLDMTMSQPSIEEMAKGYFLTKSLLGWFADHYLPVGLDRSDPTVSPFHVADLSGVAPATIITAEFDPLRDEGNLYAPAAPRCRCPGR